MIQSHIEVHKEKHQTVFLVKEHLNIKLIFQAESIYKSYYSADITSFNYQGYYASLEASKT